MAAPERACHDLLLRLAGRLPDDLLWRLRDWLAAEARGVVAALLPRALLRHRVGLTDAERDLLEAAVGGWGAPRRLLDAVLSAAAAEPPAAGFRPFPDDPDTTALALLAVVRGRPGCVELGQTLRTGGRGEQRVVLARVTEHAWSEPPWVLTATLQRVLRVHGDRTPRVEVLPADGEAPAYHRAALASSTALWRRTPTAAPALTPA